jgi:hypothetical protein
LPGACALQYANLLGYMNKAVVKRLLSTIENTSVCVLWMLLCYFNGTCQDLEPRAYIRLPVNANVILPGFNHSHGEVLTDPSVPLKDFKANVEIVTLGYARTFSLFGLTAQGFALLPFCYAHATALVFGQSQAVDRTGTADMRLRLSVLLLGGKALKLSEFPKRKIGTILGTSLTIQPPTGQYFPDKLVNLGSGRWAFKPEIALSQPVSKRWLLDLYTAVWLFTDNNSYFTGHALRSQHAIGTVQSHLSYNLSPFAWAAIDATYYVGGNSTVDGVPNDDRLSNFRWGTTLVLPTGKRSGLKIAFSKGAIVVRGSNFTTVSLGWSYSWIGKK